MVFSRSLHYQFYSWYFYTIPYLLWHTTLPSTHAARAAASISAPAISASAAATTAAQPHGGGSHP